MTNRYRDYLPAMPQKPTLVPAIHMTAAGLNSSPLLEGGNGYNPRDYHRVVCFSEHLIELSLLHEGERGDEQVRNVLAVERGGGSGVHRANYELIKRGTG